MSRDEAESFVANSAIKQDVYHVTTSGAVESIRENGFDLDKRAFGRVWGDGVYVGQDERVSEKYEKLVGPGARRIKLKIDVKDPFVQEIFDNEFNQEDLIQRAALNRGYTLADANRLTWSYSDAEDESSMSKILTEIMNKTLKYDSIILEMPDNPDASMVVIFDPKKVVFIND